MHCRLTPIRLVVAVCLFALTAPARSDVRLPGFYGDHMVFQQQMPLRIRGWADAGERVAVSLNDQSAEVDADSGGRWEVTLPAMTAGNTAHTLTVKGRNTITLNDVLIGEVWLCSGQSNMEWPVRASTHAEEEIAAADYPLIRHIKFAHRPSPVPLEDVASEWQLTSPDTVASFTAVGYFMARELHKELNVPIGLINSSWGGTRIEPWTTISGFAGVQELGVIHGNVLSRTPGTTEHEAELARYIRDLEAWIAGASADEPLTASPAFPATLKPLDVPTDPTALYNGMIHAIVGYPIRGAIWYQGESNQSEGMLYYHKMRALISGWRDIWNQNDFPFYYVQIAPFTYNNAPTLLPELWEAQNAALQIPNTGMVVINDIATLKDIHPPNKQDVGHRLALLALKNDYGRNDLVAESPRYDSFSVDGESLRVKFRLTGGALKTRDGEPPTHFEIIGPGSAGFQHATAAIDGDAVILRSARVKEPTAFRFAWDQTAEPNLTGATGLPVGAVRDGEVPSFSSQIANFDDYTLVYDLNLNKLGPEISYDVDNSRQVGHFDRVAYLLQLSGAGGDRNLFVSMKAWTDDATKIGVPTVQSGSFFQERVTSLSITSDVDGIVTGKGIESGNIEFWPSNYSPQNGRKVPGASASVFDFGDEPSPPVRGGYGSMQVHNYQAKQTLFAVNHWSEGANADIGIGNSDGNTRDWTFTGNAGKWNEKRLRVFVRLNDAP